MKAIIPGLIFLILLTMASQKRKTNGPKYEVMIKDTLFDRDTMKKFIHIYHGSIAENSKNFRTDTLEDIDSYKKLKIRIIYPRPITDSLYILGQYIRNDIDSKLSSFKYQMNSDTDSKKIPSGICSFFEAHPDHFYEDKNILSIRMIISTYLSGSAHPETNYMTLNFDKRSKSSFYLTDLFEIRTKADTDLVINGLERKFGGLSSCRKEGVSLWEFYALRYSDFTFKRDSVIFNFDDYVLGQGPSMLECKISREELASIIKSNYR